jgi:regulatory protein
VDLVLGGRHLATLSVDAVSRLGLRHGAAVDDTGLEAIAGEARALATFDRAANMLAAKSRASRELRLALLKKGEPAELVDAAVERLRELGHLDDDRFARQFSRSRIVGGGLSRRRVQGELARRGIARETADAAIEEVMAEEEVDESTTLLAAAQKRLRTLGGLDPASRRRRLYAYLARRGYASEDIMRMLDGLLDTEEEKA